MKEIKTVGRMRAQREVDDATMNFVSRQAQEAILDPTLPDFFKDQVVDSAVKTILRIAEKRNSYHVRSRESQQAKESQTIYQAK